ncbi:hypothetical protein KIPB_016615, partial [Kipferlia bialata]|eukprot:g16615.t1
MSPSSHQADDKEDDDLGLSESEKEEEEGEVNMVKAEAESESEENLEEETMGATVGSAVKMPVQSAVVATITLADPNAMVKKEEEVKEEKGDVEMGEAEADTEAETDTKKKTHK